MKLIQLIFKVLLLFLLNLVINYSVLYFLGSYQALFSDPVLLTLYVVLTIIAAYVVEFMFKGFRNA